MTYIVFRLIVSQHYPPEKIQSLSDGSHIRWVDCWVESKIGKDVYCGWLVRPIKGKINNQIRIPIILVRGTFSLFFDSPILYVSGGPGFANGLDRESFPYWLELINWYGWKNDVVLFDQRGVGLSEPSLRCPEFIAYANYILSKNLNFEENLKLYRQAGKGCLNTVMQRNIDLSQYRTIDIANDIETIIKLLGEIETGICMHLHLAPEFLQKFSVIKMLKYTV